MDSESLRPKIVQHLLLGESATRLVVLHVIVGKDPLQHHKIGIHQRTITSFMQRKNLRLVVLQLIVLLFLVHLFVIVPPHHELP